MRKKRKFYDVYAHGAYVHGAYVAEHLSAREIAELTGYSDAYIRLCARDGKKLGGEYVVVPARDSGHEDRMYTEKEARAKFGNRNYEEWCAMNERYGRKCCG